MKQNLAPDQLGIGYRLDSCRVDGAGEVGVVWWGAEAAVDADAMLAPPEPEPRDAKRAECEAFVRDLLADGPRPAAECQAGCEGAGFGGGTITRAKRALGVESKKQGFQGWVWRFRAEGATPADADAIPP